MQLPNLRGDSCDSIFRTGKINQTTTPTDGGGFNLEILQTQNLRLRYRHILLTLRGGAGTSGTAFAPKLDLEKRCRIPMKNDKRWKVLAQSGWDGDKLGWGEVNRTIKAINSIKIKFLFINSGALPASDGWEFRGGFSILGPCIWPGRVAPPLGKESIIFSCLKRFFFPFAEADKFFC